MTTTTQTNPAETLDIADDEVLPVLAVNATGLAEIKSFLVANHVKQGHDWSLGQLSAWAHMAERQMDIGNPPVIELRSWESLTGRPEQYQISDAGITTNL